MRATDFLLVRKHMIRAIVVVCENLKSLVYALNLSDGTIKKLEAHVSLLTSGSTLTR